LSRGKITPAASGNQVKDSLIDPIIKAWGTTDFPQFCWKQQNNRTTKQQINITTQQMFKTTEQQHNRITLQQNNNC
jgi:hypothetical protein